MPDDSTAVLSPVPEVAEEKQTETSNATPIPSPVPEVAEKKQTKKLPDDSTPVQTPVPVVAEKNQTEIFPSNSTPIPSPIPTHDDPCGDRFCAICVEGCIISNEEVYDNLPTPSPMTATSTNVTPTTNKVSRKKTYKMDIGKKRLSHKENWSVVQRKKKKNEGKAFTNNKGKQIAEKKLGDSCGRKCRYKCTENFELKQRETIFSKFWELGDRNKHWEFVIKYTKKIPKGRNTTDVVKHKREYTYVYYLPTEEKEKRRVCKKMFLNTISSGERIVTTAWKKYDGLAALEEDKRGRYDHQHRVINEVMVQSVKDHVNCLDRVESHYARRDSKKLYLNNITSTSQMYKLYSEWYDSDKYDNKANIRQYRDIVNDNFNLAFHKPKKDQCEVCHVFTNNQFPSEEEKQTFLAHQDHKKKARALKQTDKDEAIQNTKIVAATFDFQKVLQTPHGEVSIFYYKRKLNTANFTVFDLANKAATCLHVARGNC